MCVKHFRDCMPLLDATALVLSSAREKAQFLNLSKMELGTLCKNWDVNRQFLELLRLCEEFTSKMYSKKNFANGVSNLRYKLWVQNPSNDSMLLPPTIDALSHHVNRTNYQALLWRTAMIAGYQAPTPNGCGWEVNNSLLNII